MLNFNIKSVETFGSVYVAQTQFGLWEEMKPTRVAVEFGDGQGMDFVTDHYGDWKVYCTYRFHRGWRYPSPLTSLTD